MEATTSLMHELVQIPGLQLSITGGDQQSLRVRLECTFGGKQYASQADLPETELEEAGPVVMRMAQAMRRFVQRGGTRAWE